MSASADVLAYYASPGVMTDPGEESGLLAGLPEDLAGLCEVVQGNLLHIYWAGAYGRTLTDAAQAAVSIRPLRRKLEWIRHLDSRPLVEPRPLEARQVGNCRDFTLLLTGLLRTQGRPARARCGFATYFIPGHYEDHWVAEVWDPARGDWRLVDAQLDALQREKLALDFEPLDVPRSRFVAGGQAWQMCRAGQADPAHFGIMDMSGWWFVWGNVVRDFLAQNKVEILPWDVELPVFIHALEDPLPEAGEELDFYDRIAALTLAGEAGFDALRAEYESNARWQAPPEWVS